MRGTERSSVSALHHYSVTCTLNSCGAHHDTIEIAKSKRFQMDAIGSLGFGRLRLPFPVPLREKPRFKPSCCWEESSSGKELLLLLPYAARLSTDGKDLLLLLAYAALLAQDDCILESEPDVDAAANPMACSRCFSGCWQILELETDWNSAAEPMASSVCFSG